MIRRGIALLLLAGGLAVYAVREMVVGSGSQSEPLSVDLARLEAGETPESNYVRIGEHLPAYDGAVYRTPEQPGHAAAPNAKISYCYYPIISASHPFTQALRRIQAGQVPDGAVEVAELSNFRVLVRSQRFATLDEMPKVLTTRDFVDGLITNRIASLRADEAALIKKSFPKLNLDELLILEEDRKPTSMWLGIAMMVGALALTGAGVGIIVLTKKAAALDKDAASS